MSRRGPGSFVAIVGPSGAGKDSVIAYASERLRGDGQFLFVRRTVTRSADPVSEDHYSLTEEAFAQALAAGAFAISWAAHGHRYGLPKTVDAAIAGGATVVANVSRRVLPELEARYAHCFTVLIAADPAIIRLRLLARGREDEAAIEARLAAHDRPVGATSLIEIDNSGDLAIAGEAVLSLLRDTRLLSHPVARPGRGPELPLP